MILVAVVPGSSSKPCLPRCLVLEITWVKKRDNPSNGSLWVFFCLSRENNCSDYNFHIASFQVENRDSHIWQYYNFLKVIKNCLPPRGKKKAHLHCTISCYLSSGTWTNIISIKMITLPWPCFQRIQFNFQKCLKAIELFCIRTTWFVTMSHKESLLIANPIPSAQFSLL